MLHTLLWLITLPISMAVTGSYLMLILHLIAGIPLVIYVPAALVLSMKDSPSKFTHAGGEIAYVTIQLAAWLGECLDVPCHHQPITTASERAALTPGSAIAAVLLAVVSETRCYDGFSIYDDMEMSIWRRPDACWALWVVTAFSFTQVILTIMWLAIVAHKAQHTAGLKPSQAYKVPTHRLLVGKVGGDDYAMSGRRRSSDVERAKKNAEEDD